MKAIGEFYNDKQLFKIGVTSSRLGKNRIKQQSIKVGCEYEEVLHEDVICKATKLEKEIHKLGTNPKLTGFDGATEIRAFNDEELKKTFKIIESYIK